MIQTIDGLAALAGRYDVLLSDVWGVIHNGRESFAGPCAALARWRAEVGPVVLISNAARPSAPVAEQLDGLGVPRTAWSALVTSGDVTRRLLAERAPGPAYRIGADRVMWSSDYPHQESTFGYTRSAIQAVFDATSVENAQKIVGKTALEVFAMG